MEYLNDELPADLSKRTVELANFEKEIQQLGYTGWALASLPIMLGEAAAMHIAGLSLPQSPVALIASLTGLAIVPLSPCFAKLKDAASVWNFPMTNGKATTTNKFKLALNAFIPGAQWLARKCRPQDYTYNRFRQTSDPRLK